MTPGSCTSKIWSGEELAVSHLSTTRSQILVHRLHVLTWALASLEAKLLYLEDMVASALPDRTSMTFSPLTSRMRNGSRSRLSTKDQKVEVDAVSSENLRKKLPTRYSSTADGTPRSNTMRSGCLISTRRSGLTAISSMVSQDGIIVLSSLRPFQPRNSSSLEVNVPSIMRVSPEPSENTSTPAATSISE